MIHFNMDGHGNYYSPFYSSFYHGYPHSMLNQQAQASGLQPQLQIGASNVITSPVPSTAPLPTTTRPSTSSSTATEVEEAESASESMKRVYEKWTEEEQKLLINLWSEHFERLESKESRKVWDEIADKINTKFQSKRPERPASKFKNKIKYLLDRYKKAKDWNVKQTGGHRRKSIFFDEIDEVLGCREVVALKHVEEAGSKSSPSNSKISSDCSNEEEEQESSKNKRKERKKKRKRVVEEESDEEERKFFKAAVSGLEAQRTDMNSFVENFNRIQTQQLNTMNTLVGALTKFLEKQ